MQNQPVPSGARTLATISIICGGLGLIVLPIPLGLAALACGIPGLAMNAKGGVLGIIVGLIDIVIGIALIASFAGLQQQNAVQYVALGATRSRTAPPCHSDELSPNKVLGHASPERVLLEWAYTAIVLLIWVRLRGDYDESHK